ncbi:MAG: hypothetical protein RSC06_10745 [Clostridia bacterium]
MAMKRNDQAEEPTTESTSEAVKVVESIPDIVESVARSDGFCVYIGPSIRGCVQSGTIMPGTRDTALAACYDVIQQYPHIADLIVPSETIATDRMKVKTPGNLLNKYFNDLASMIKSK